MGLRDLRSAPSSQAKAAKPKAALPVFKQYREKDGRFHFKLVAADGRELLVSEGFASPKEAGELIARLKSSDETRMTLDDGRVRLDGSDIGALAPAIGIAELRAALKALAE